MCTIERLKKAAISCVIILYKSSLYDFNMAGNMQRNPVIKQLKMSEILAVTEMFQHPPPLNIPIYEDIYHLTSTEFCEVHEQNKLNTHKNNTK